MAKEAMQNKTATADQSIEGQGVGVGQEGTSLKDSDLTHSSSDQEASFISQNRDTTSPSASDSKHQNVMDGDGLSSSWAFNTASHYVRPDGVTHWNLTDPGCFITSMSPLFYPAPFCGLVPTPSHDQQLEQGLFAAPFYPYAWPVAFVPLGGLVPLSYNAPLGVTARSDQHVRLTSGQPPNAASTERVVAPAGPESVAQEGIRQRHAAAAPVAEAPEAQPRRQVVWRFQAGFQLDLLLILKLTVAVYFFNRNGSMERLLLLSFLAALFYTYQTGALTPTLRWITITAQRFMMRPRQALHRTPNGQAQHGTGAVGVADEVGNGPGDAILAPPEQHPARVLTWFGFLKEIQILVIGFVASLLPGFQNPE